MMPVAALGPLLAAGLLAQVAAFPAVDVAKICAAAAPFGPRDKSYGICLRDEGAARGRLRALWPKLTAKDREICLGTSELGVATSYVDIVGCIAMNRELRREQSLPPDHALPPQ